jgi:hypothetical protein
LCRFEVQPGKRYKFTNLIRRGEILATLLAQWQKAVPDRPLSAIFNEGPDEEDVSDQEDAQSLRYVCKPRSVQSAWHHML